ncbi:MAG TPA: hypothetical protein VEC11_10735 [Allosphingosinicella sp.]|nr:hypothetical protein [Allosphingosinicella sp.]
MTRPAALRSFDRAATFLALIFALGLLAELVRSSLAGGVAREILIGLPGLLWVAAPSLVAAAFVGASSTRAGAGAFLALEIALILSVIAQLLWGGPLGLMFLPLLQAGAILLVFLGALALGWRMRPDFLRD